MTTPFQNVLLSHVPNKFIYYGYDTTSGDKIPTREEYDEIFKKCVVENKDMLMDMVRQERNKMLKGTDMYMLIDYPLTDEEKTRVIEYRQKLRDITNGDLPKMSRVDYVLEFDLSRENLLKIVVE